MKNQVFHSFAELADAMNVKPKAKKVDAAKRKAQQEKFLTCRKCGQQMTYIGNSNVVVCKNDITTDDGKIKPCGMTRILDATGSQIAETLFA